MTDQQGPRSGFLIKIDHNFIGHGIALASQDKATSDFVIFESKIDIHVDLTLDNFATAG
jgi:hypothetical protein